MFDHSCGRAARTLIVFLALLGTRAQALTLQETQQLAETAQPLLEGKRAAIESARQAAVAARQLPDPKLKLGILNVPVEGPEAFTVGQDFMTMRMLGVMQEFPRGAKRELKGEMLRLEGERSARELEFSRLQVRRDAAITWIDTWIATRAVALVQAQQAEAATQIDALQIALRNNRATAADVSAARIELELLKDREQMLLGEERVARAMLSRWIGSRSQDPLPETLPDLPKPASAEELLRHVESHPHLAAADVQARIAAAEAQLANLSARPDWNVEVSYQKRGSAFSDMVSVQFGIDLPIFQTNRQDRTVAAKFAQAQAARDAREDSLREMRADALRLYATWDVANKRVDAYRERILPEARLRLETALAAYRGGKGALHDVLAARRARLDLELEHVIRQADAAKAALALHYFAHANGGQR